MNKAMLTIYGHNGSLISEEEIAMPHLPRVGEIIRTHEEFDNTKEFIVTDITYQLHKKQLFPYVECRSLYSKKGEYNRLDCLREGKWLPEH